MSISKLLFAASISGLLYTSCQQASKAPAENHVAATEKPAINAEKLETASFNIEGMTCAMGCAKTIEKELTEMDGVQKAVVDFDNKTATVSFDSSIQTPESLTKTVEAAADGKTYKVSNIIASK